MFDFVKISLYRDKIPEYRSESREIFRKRGRTLQACSVSSVPRQIENEITACLVPEPFSSLIPSLGSSLDHVITNVLMDPIYSQLVMSFDFLNSQYLLNKFCPTVLALPSQAWIPKEMSRKGCGLHVIYFDW